MSELVVYFSRKGYVRSYAERIASDKNADIYEVKTTERTDGLPGFLWCGRFGMHRWEMQISPVNIDISRYDRVTVCSPVWVFTVSAPIRAFLAQSAGKIRSADYILLHFSNPMRYRKTVEIMDDLAGIRHDSYTSVCCMLGKIIHERRYENENSNGK